MNSALLPAVMVAMAKAQELSIVLDTIVRGIAECEHVALARVWLIAPGDVCGECAFRAECPNQDRCLHLVASAGNPRFAGADYSRTDGAFRRFPLGVRKIGRIATSGEGLFAPGLRGDEEWVAHPDWLAREGVRTFAGQPLVYAGETLGVIALFDRGELRQTDFDWLRVFADHAAVSIANRRAFDEIARLRALLEEENHYLREEVNDAIGAGDLVGESPGLRKVQQQIRLVAGTDATVLIQGESGVGKELVARAIHEQSSRSKRALIRVNCGAVPESLFESEFFGHVRGAFTGALKDRLGRFELAGGGTLFLDEIGETPLAMQAKLLRVLQEGEFERVGDTRTRTVDVRVVAATNRDLKAEVDAGRFRQDLYYRLSVFPIEVPPLRERPDDLRALAAHFIERTARKLKRTPPRLGMAAVEQLLQHDWPGNVRELQNAVERAVIVSGRGALQFDLPRARRGPKRASAGSLEPHSAAVAPTTLADLKELERRLLVDTLRATKGRIFGADGAAQRLGLPPTTLTSRLKALGIDRREFE